METNASVDIGNNLTSLLERLAQQIGTTVDQVFPWYVNQAHIEGMTTLLFLGASYLIFIPTFVIALVKSDFNDANKATFITTGMGVALVFTLLGTAMEAPDAVRKLLNPNYYAVKMITRDIGNMAGH